MFSSLGNLRSLLALARDNIKSDTHNRQGQSSEKKKKKKKRSDNNLLFVVTVTKLVMKPEPGSSCLSGCLGRGLGAVSGRVVRSKSLAVIITFTAQNWPSCQAWSSPRSHCAASLRCCRSLKFQRGGEMGQNLFCSTKLCVFMFLFVTPVFL